MTQSRLIKVIAGVLIMLPAGMLYAWSVISTPIAEEFTGWSMAQLSLTFTLTTAFLCCAQIITGSLSSKLSPQNAIRIAAALMLGGLYLASRTQGIMMLHTGFGLMCGFGAGMAYISVMGSVVKWFPDKRGLVSGILLMGFGLSSFIAGKLYQAFTPAYVGGWRVSFVVMGLIAFVVLFLCGFFIEAPRHAEGESTQKTEGITTGQMLKKAKFRLYYVWQVILSAAGLMIISQASRVLTLASPGVTASFIATAVGVISILNGTGRVVFGRLYDKLGRRISMLLISLCFVVAPLILYAGTAVHSSALVICAFTVMGLGYGGVPVCNSAFIASSFGMAHYDTNYPVCNSALIIASFGGTIAGFLYDASGAYTAVFALMLALAAVSLLCTGGITRCEKKET